MTQQKIVIFASGEGSNAQRIMEHFRNSTLAKVILVVSNKKDAKVLEKAEHFQIPTLIINREDFYNSENVLSFLQERSADLIILAGFLWLIPQNLISAYPDRIINIHPALLPKFGGKGMFGKYVHQAVIDAEEKQSGITIHLVNAKYDEGRILSQHVCNVEPFDTIQSLASRIQKLEQEFFPKVIENYIKEM